MRTVWVLLLFGSIITYHFLTPVSGEEAVPSSSSTEPKPSFDQCKPYVDAALKTGSSSSDSSPPPGGGDEESSEEKDDDGGESSEEEGGSVEGDEKAEDEDGKGDNDGVDDSKESGEVDEAGEEGESKEDQNASSEEESGENDDGEKDSKEEGGDSQQESVESEEAEDKEDAASTAETTESGEDDASQEDSKEEAESTEGETDEEAGSKEEEESDQSSEEEDAPATEEDGQEDEESKEAEDEEEEATSSEEDGSDEGDEAADEGEQADGVAASEEDEESPTDGGESAEDSGEEGESDGTLRSDVADEADESKSTEDEEEEGQETQEDKDSAEDATDDSEAAADVSGEDAEKASEEGEADEDKSGESAEGDEEESAEGGEKESAEGEGVEESAETEEEGADESADSKGDDDGDKSDEETVASEGEGEEEESGESKESEEGSQSEEEEEEEDEVEPYIPRSRAHLTEILGLDDSDTTKTTFALLSQATQSTLKELKRIYENAIKPLEKVYKYRDLSNRHFGDPEIFSKPLVVFMGPWSGGKSTIINWLLGTQHEESALRTGADPSPAQFNIMMYGKEDEVLDGTQLAADWTFSGLQKFGQSFLDRLRGRKLPNRLLEKVNIVEIPGILEVRKQVERSFPFNDACQWFIDRADVLFLVYDPAKLDIGPETEAILDQLKGRESQVRIVLNKADTVTPDELLRVQAMLVWNISPLMSSAEPPVMYAASLWDHPFQPDSPRALLTVHENNFLKDIRDGVHKQVETRIAAARRFAVRVRNHAKMVDCYLNTFHVHRSFFADRKKISNDIIDHPQNYHIYEGLSTLTNISRYDLPDPDTYKDFFKLNHLWDFPTLSSTCSYFKGCPINKLDIAIAYELPELLGKFRRQRDSILSAQAAGATTAASPNKK